MEKLNIKISETNAQKYWSKQLISRPNQVKNPITNEMVEQLLNPGLMDFKKLFKTSKKEK